MDLDVVTLELRTQEQLRVPLTEFPLLESICCGSPESRRSASKGTLGSCRGASLPRREICARGKRTPAGTERDGASARGLGPGSA
jgi:hypothetical protein